MQESNTDKIELDGGRSASIFKSGKTVIRPSSPFSKNIHQFLYNLQEHGFLKCPIPYGFDEKGNEILSFIEGHVSNYPLTEQFSSMDTVYSAGKILREFHDVSEKIFSDTPKNLKWLLPNTENTDIICHGDFAPYNVVVDNKEVIGIIDFDTAHFGNKIEDVAYGTYRWATLFRENSSDKIGPLEIQIQRAQAFCDGYELDNESRKELIYYIIARISALVQFMRTNAQNGNQAFQENIRDGHDIGYLADIEYLKENRSRIEKGICAD